MDNVSELRRPIEFTIDGRPYTTTDHKQLGRGPAPARRPRPQPASTSASSRATAPSPVRYTDDTIVEIHNKARFVSIRHRADVA